MSAAQRIRSSLPQRAPSGLTVAAASDPLERTAEQVAEQVMRMPDPGPALAQRSPDGAQPLQRQAAEEPEEDEEPYPFPAEPIGIGSVPVGKDDESQVIRRTATAAADGGRSEAAALGLPTSSARRLPGSVRGWMEARFGADLQHVRIHTDAAAGHASRALHADAFTVGADVYFARGRYQPQTGPGRRLLAHELAHVLQSADSAHARFARRSIATAYSNYRDTCDCGEDLGNNCAHYLSDSFIRSGYASELDGGTGARYRRVNGRIVCKSGRPVRAKEFRDWFASKASTTEDGERSDSGYWAVYQERRRDGQGHVNIHSHSSGSYDWVGTTDLPSWRTQTHYSW